MGLTPGWGTNILYAMQYGQKKRRLNKLMLPIKRSLAGSDLNRCVHTCTHTHTKVYLSLNSLVSSLWLLMQAPANVTLAVQWWGQRSRDPQRTSSSAPRMYTDVKMSTVNRTSWCAWERKPYIAPRLLTVSGWDLWNRQCTDGQKAGLQFNPVQPNVT